jgi:pectin methylesterase-like acyl-CoA thioesterase
MSWLESRCLLCAAAVGGALFTVPTLGTAATLCVSSHPLPGCDNTYTTIQDAVDAAASGDIVKVVPGHYQEDVHITIPLSLIGAGAANTVIDATSQSNGIFVDGNVDGTPGSNTLKDVVVTGFTVENANFEGILIANASFVTVRGNTLVNNDLSLSNGTCPGIPDFETNEGFDCGEAIHLTGVDHATIADNDIEHNAGGILVSDDTGPTHDNLIAGNKTANNPYDCGITFASHDPYGTPPP